MELKDILVPDGMVPEEMISGNGIRAQTPGLKSKISLELLAILQLLLQLETTLLLEQVLMFAGQITIYGSITYKQLPPLYAFLPHQPNQLARTHVQFVLVILTAMAKW